MLIRRLQTCKSWQRCGTDEPAAEVTRPACVSDTCLAAGGIWFDRLPRRRRWRAPSPAATSRHQKDPLATRLLVEHAIGRIRLLELPAVREQVIDRKLAIRDEARALGLHRVGEGPGTDNG